ncbi:MAG: tetratricopeptide repeat protein [Eubacteriales bacterium]|nr:tetratricopeptide repeat protein [Eubacteriales bacterium]
MGLFKKTPEDLWQKAKAALDRGSSKAVELLIDAGNAGYVRAWEELGNIYRDVSSLTYKDQNKPDQESFDLAVQYYRKAADGGIKRAWRKIGDLYLDQSLGVEENPLKAIRYYEKGGSEGDDIALLRAADMYRHGRHVMRDPQEAFRLYEIAWHNGQYTAYACMGEMYEYGELGEKDLDKALEIYGDLYEYSGEEVEEDVIPVRNAQLKYLVHTNPETLDFEQLRCAAENEYHSGNYELACQLWDRAEDISTVYESLDAEDETLRQESQNRLDVRKGRIVCYTAEAYISYALEMRDEGEFAAAFTYFQRAAELGSARGTNGMATACLAGRGVAKDEEKGRALLLQAAEAGSVHAWCNLGLYYRDGKFGFPQDASKAADCLRKASDLGDGVASYALGKLYQKGNGVEQDEEKALEYYQRAYAAKDNWGAYSCAWIYRDRYNETNDPSDREKMLEYYVMSAEKGLGYACVELGSIYLHGDLGVEKDTDRAFYFLERAAWKDITSAQSDIAGMYYYEIYGKQNFEAAFYWSRRAAKAGDMAAQYLYGCLCGTSWVLVGDEDEAWKWIEASALQGYAPAVEMMKKHT